MNIRSHRPILFFIFFMFCVLVQQSHARKIRFGHPFSLDVGNQPFFITIGDIDNDGYADIVVANTNSDSITVWLNDGDGKFYTSTTTQVPDQPNSVAIGNFDGGFPDLVTANHSGSVSVLFGDGSGNFPTQAILATLPVANGPRIAIVRKLNTDNFDDIAVCSDNTGSFGKVSVWLGDGAGGFGARSDFSVALNGGQSLAAGDFEPDGDIDLVTTNAAEASISVLLNDGNANFTTLAPKTIGTSTVDAAVAFIDKGIVSDLAVVDVSSNNIAILLGQGDGTFVNGTPPTLTVGQGPTRIAASDLNADGRTDLVVTNWTENSISILKGRSKGRFKTLPNLQGFPDLASPISLVIGDLNNDAKPDLVVGNFDVDKVLVFLNRTHPKN